MQKVVLELKFPPIYRAGVILLLIEVKCLDEWY